MGRAYSMHRQMEKACKTAVGKCKGRDCFGDLDIDGTIILKGIVEKLSRCGLDTAATRNGVCGWNL